MIAVTIVACEIGFWVLLLGGLTARYVAGRPRLGAVLLAGAPLADVVLLAVTAFDLTRGAEANWTHGLAAVYLGFSVAFGPMWVRSADERFAARFGDGARPAAASVSASAGDRLAAHWRLWLRCLAACALASVVLTGLVLLAGEPDRTRALWEDGGWFAQLGALSAVWLVLGPLWTAAAQHLRSTRREGDVPT